MNAIGIIGAMSAESSNAEWKKWASEAGPRNTKKVTKVVSAFRHHGTGHVKLSGVKGEDEWESKVFTFGDGPNESCVKFHEEIFAEFEGTITNKNYKAIIAAYNERMPLVEFEVVDERRTPEEDAADKVEREANMEKWAKEREAKESEVERLAAKYREENPWRKTKGSKWARAAANIKTELSKEFPGVKFKCKSESYSGGCSVRVFWTDGPKVEDVEPIANAYKEGNFNGMIDMYESDHSAAATARS